MVNYQVNEGELDDMCVRISSTNINKTIEYIKSIMQSFDPHFKVEYQFYNEFIDSLYKQEEKQAQTIKIFALIAILLSCLGLYGMVEFTCKQKTKEIGIRKVNGARVSEILNMLNAEFVKWVVVAFVIACPVSWYIMNKWLEDFGYRTELSWWVFALAGGIAISIALFAVSWQSWWAARRNPVEALRYE